MNMRIEKPAALPLRGARPARRAPQAAVAPVARAVAALSFDLDAEDPRGGRLDGAIGGEALPRPVVSTRLPLRRGGWRHVLLVGRSAERLARTPCRLTLDGEPAARIDPDWLQSPLVDLAALIEGLTEDGRRRLLKLTLTTGASLFGSGRTPGYGAAVRRLLRLLAVPELAPASACALGAAGRILTFRLPAGEAPSFEALAALTEDRVARIGGFSMQVEAHPRGALLHLHAPAAPGEGLLVGVGTSPLALGAPDGAQTRPLAPWLARRPEAVRAWAADLLEAAAPDAATAALLREARSLDAPPEVAIRHVSATAGGVLLLAEARDPHDLLDALRVELGDAAQDLPLDGRARVGGFLDLPGARPGAPCRLRLVFKSGRTQVIREARLDAFDGAVPDGFAKLPPALAAPALAAARLSLRRPDPVLRVETIGTPPRRPRLALVAAAGTPDLVRARAALLAGEPDAGRVEIVHHAPAAEAAAARRALEGVHAVFGLASRLVTLPDGAHPAERLRAALGAARGPALVLGAEALPAEAGWLAPWTAALRSGRAPRILGAALLAPDGSVADAGARLRAEGEDGAARIERRWEGLPAGALPPVLEPAELVGAECFGLNAAAVAAFRAAQPTHPSVEVALFDLARRLGGRRRFVQGRFIRFGEGCAPDRLAEAADAQAMAALRAGKGGA